MKVRVLLRTPFEPITESYYPQKPLGHPLARFPWPQARPFVGSAVSLSGQSGLFIRAWRGFESRTANHRNLSAGEAALPPGPSVAALCFRAGATSDRSGFACTTFGPNGRRLSANWAKALSDAIHLPIFTEESLNYQSAVNTQRTPLFG